MYSVGPLHLFQVNTGKRRQRQQNRLAAVVPIDRFTCHWLCIDYMAAAVNISIAVEYLFVYARFRHANPVIVTYNRRKVANSYNFLSTAGRNASIGKNAAIAVTIINPFKPFP